jgi:ketosteroid isomerase-like protein
MSRENVDLVQRVLARFVATGEPKWDTSSGEIEFHDHVIMDAGEYRGQTGFGRWLGDWNAAWSEFSIEPEEFLDAGRHVVSFIRMTATGRSSGIAVERQDAMVWEVRDGEIVRLDYYNDRTQALEAVGLADG